MQAQRYRDKVNKIILYPSSHHGLLNLESFAKEVLPETWVELVPIDYGIQDWRQAETDPCIARSDAEWLFFNEQDLFIKDWDKFWDDVEKAMVYSDAIGLWNPTHFPYLHPSCFFIKRELFEKTNKDFRAHPEINGGDHFCMLTRDIERLGGKITTLQDLGYVEWEDMFHLGGLTYVYQDWRGDGTDAFGVKNLETFAVYNYMLRQADVVQNDNFLMLSHNVEQKLLEKIGPVDFVNNKWTKFFI